MQLRTGKQTGKIETSIRSIDNVTEFREQIRLFLENVNKYKYENKYCYLSAMVELYQYMNDHINYVKNNDIIQKMMITFRTHTIKLMGEIPLSTLLNYKDENICEVLIKLSDSMIKFLAKIGPENTI